MDIWLQGMDTTLYRFLVTSAVAFGQKCRYFTDKNGPKGGPHEKNFEYFQIQK